MVCACVCVCFFLHESVRECVVFCCLKLSFGFAHFVATPSSSSCLVCLWSWSSVHLEAHLHTHPTTVTGNQACAQTSVRLLGTSVRCVARVDLPSLPSVLFPSILQPALLHTSTRNPTHRTASPLHPTQSNMVLFGGRGGGGRSTGVASTPSAPAPRYVLPPASPCSFPPSLSPHEL